MSPLVPTVVRRKIEYPVRWKYPLNLLEVGESLTVPAEAYWPINAARTRAEKKLKWKFTLRRDADTLTITREK